MVAAGQVHGGLEHVVKVHSTGMSLLIGLRLWWAHQWLGKTNVPAIARKLCTVFVVTVASCVCGSSTESPELCRYGATKWASEVQLQQLHERHGVPVSIFRCGMILAHRRRVQGFLIVRTDVHLTSGGLLCVCSLHHPSKLLGALKQFAMHMTMVSCVW